MTDYTSFFEEATDFLALGELKQAEEAYRRCTEINPSSFEAWHALSLVFMKQSLYQEAIEAGLKAVALEPQEQLAWSSLSLCYAKNGQIELAEKAGGKARILSWGGKLLEES